MTLSPGEEYENYQKVRATMMVDDSMYVTEDGMDEVCPEEDEDEEQEGEKEEEDNNASGSGSNRKTPSLSRSRSAKDRLAKEEQAQREELRKAAGITIRNAPSRRQIALLHTARTVRGKEDLQRPTTRMIDPLGRFRLFWDLTSITFIFYNAIVLPVGQVLHVDKWKS
jgi:hypothetical protein